MKEEIKAVIFDIGGVLQEGVKTRYKRKDLHTSGVHEKVAKKLKISISQYFDAIDSSYTKSIEGQITKSKLLSEFSKRLNAPKSKIENLYYKFYKRTYKKNKELYKIAKQLKKQGYKIAILSDQWHLSKKAHAPKKDMEIFDKVVISCDVGTRKPNKEMYELVLKKLKLKPQQCLFIDNQQWNIIPANKIGFNTILFTNNKKTKSQLKEFGIKLP